MVYTAHLYCKLADGGSYCFTDIKNQWTLIANRSTISSIYHPYLWYSYNMLKPHPPMIDGWESLAKVSTSCLHYSSWGTRCPHRGRAEGSCAERTRSRERRCRSRPRPQSSRRLCRHILGQIGEIHGCFPLVEVKILMGYPLVEVKIHRNCWDKNGCPFPLNMAYRKVLIITDP